MPTYKHLEGVETEFDPADRGRQVWLHVGVLTSCSHGFGVREGLREDAKVDTDLDVLIILACRQQERIISISELKRCARWHLFAEEGVIVLLVQDDLLLGQPDILKHLIEIKGPLANVVIRLEEVKVPSLHNEKKRILSRRLYVEQNTPIERCGSRRASEMSVSVLLVVIIDV